MNVGYMNTKDFFNQINNEVCPICGKNIYVSKYQNNFACVDTECALGHGAVELVKKINRLLNMLE